MKLRRLLRVRAHAVRLSTIPGMSTTAALPAPNAPSGYLLPDLADLVLEVGASYPLLAYALQADEEFDERTALDPIILAGLVHP
jgi:hypothetical protein